MSWYSTPLRADTESRQLLQATSRSLILTIGGLYLAWHFIATLSWPQRFSPSLWLVSLLMLGVVLVSLRLLEEHYLLAQATWMGGLMAALFLAFYLYQQPLVLLLLVFLPLIAIVTAGIYGTLLVVGLIILLVYWLPGQLSLAALPGGYTAGIMLGSFFTAIFGWGLSNNLISALGAASYHFHEARRLLDETRLHRAEISRMLKDREQTNYQLERLNQMLYFARVRAEEARSDRDRFVLAVSHELRSPLNLIIGFTDLMVKSPETYSPLPDWPPGLYDDVQDVFHSSTHLLSLINDILDLGQIDAQQMSLLREKTRIELIFDEVQKMVQPSFAEKGLWLREEIEPGLPEVFVDRTRLRQVLLNLLNNSLRFTEQGGVTVSVQARQDDLLVTVLDTGVGIAPEDVDSVFEEFRQVGSDSWHRRSGSGLGLSISQRFIQLHGGRIWLESQPGEGTRFFFTIPRLPEVGELPAKADPLALPAAFIPDPARAGKLVLLLSDDDGAAALVQEWLPEYSVATISDPAQLPECVRKLLPQALLVDRAAFPAPLKGLPYDLPVLRMPLPGRDERSALPEGVAAYLVKPVPWQRLVETVQAVSPQARRLLFVDDDPAMLRLFVQAVKATRSRDPAAAEYEILPAETGEQALQLLAGEVFDVVLLDLDLPDIDGWNVLAQIRQGQAGSQPPVIVVSALDLPQMLTFGGQSVLEIVKARPLTTDEQGAALRGLLTALQPVYLKQADVNDSAPPEEPAG